MKLRRNIRRRLLPFVCLYFGVASVNADVLTHTYDPLNRLTNAAYTDGSRESYSHDPAGNRLTRITQKAAVRKDTSAPAIPSGVRVVVLSPTERLLVWNRASDTGGSGLAGYLVYTNGVLFTIVTTTNAVLSGLLFDKLYLVFVSSFDKSFNASPPSPYLAFFIPSNGNLQSSLLTILSSLPGRFDFMLYGNVGSNYVIQASSNLADWVPIFTNTIPAGFLSLIPYSEVANHSHQFYRAVLFANGPPQPAELIVNGSFEIPIPEMAEGGSVGLPPGDLRLPGWTISGTGGPVYCSTTGVEAANGTNVLRFNLGDALAGTSISQTFRTTPGIVYSLTFSIRRLLGTSDYRLRFRTTVRSETNELLGSDDSIPPPQFHWGLVRIDFTATTETTTITFLDDTLDTRGTDLLLDRVSILRFAP